MSRDSLKKDIGRLMAAGYIIPGAASVRVKRIGIPVETMTDVQLDQSFERFSRGITAKELADTVSRPVTKQ